MKSSSSRNFIYRIMRFDHAVEVLKENGTLHFSHPSSWEDPYETRVKHEYDHAIFAQCWSKAAASDAMWRIYSPNMLGVRLRTTKTDLESVMQTYTKSNKGFKRRLKDVIYRAPGRYRSETGLLEVMMDHEEFRSPRTAADLLCIKRAAFNHEKEVRAILYNENAERNQTGKIEPIKVPVDGKKLISSIMFDPRTPDVLCEAMKHYLVNVVGFKGEIDKSKLYTVEQ